jgi:hypothetical protein
MSKREKQMGIEKEQKSQYIAEREREAFQIIARHCHIIEQTRLFILCLVAAFYSPTRQKEFVSVEKTPTSFEFSKEQRVVMMMVASFSLSLFLYLSSLVCGTLLCLVTNNQNKLQLQTSFCVREGFIIFRWWEVRHLHHCHAAACLCLSARCCSAGLDFEI